MSEERTSMRPSWKLDAEPPPKVKAAIRNMIKIPLEDIETTFPRFTWDYDKGNFHHWTELFLHFDEIFRKQVCSRKDLQLSDNYLNADDPFPKGAVLQILRVMRIILENCQNKSSFNGLEHFTKLLASTDPDILIAALQALAAFVRINPSKLHVGGKLPGVTVLNHHLLSLSQGWGSNEEGLGLFSCVVDNGCDDLAYQLGSTLHFEFYANGNACFGENRESRQASGLQVIHIPELHFQSESDTVLLKQFVDQYQIPIELRFSLLTRIRYACAFRSLITRRQYVCIRLLAFMVLVQSNDVHEELVAFFANDPEFINEIIKVVQSEEIVPENIRTLAMLALASQLAAHSVSHKQIRILNVSTINTGGNRLLLLNLLQKSILSVASHTESCSVSLVEALLYFFRAHVMSFSSSGSAIRETGLVPALLSLLQDTNSSHIYLVSFAVKTLKKFMDYSNPAVILFRDLGGFDDMIGRLQIEVSRIVEASEESKAAIGLEDQIPYCQRRLIKALLKALGSRTYAPVNSSRPQGLEETALPASLSLIFHHAKRFGGDIFYSAVTLMNDIIHKDPTCFSNLHTAGLPIAFLDAVTYGLLPSSKALRCIPGGLDALCLNNIGLQAVKDRNALQFLVEVFTSRKYLLALSECVGPLAYAMEELLRHVPSLRGPCVDVLVEILEKIASIGGTDFANLEGLGSPVPMDPDPEDKHNEGHDATVQATGLMVDGGSNEHFIQRCIFHVMALMHRAMENAETCRLFVEKKGIEVLIRFLTLPDIPQSYEGMSHFVHIVAVFKAFNQQYSAPLAQAFCCCLRQHLKITFSQLNPVAGTSLLVLENGKKRRAFQCLFVIQFFMFIADGLRENRWMTALLTEFGNDSKDVLHDIGRIHRDIL